MKLSDEIIKDVASWLDNGMTCFIHKETHKVLYMPNPIEFYDAEGFDDVRDEIESKEAEYLQIDKMSTYASFKRMERFVEEVSDTTIKERLRYALENRKPFRNFKYEVNQVEDVRQQWFQFRSKVCEEWVKNEISFKTTDEEE